MVVDVDRERRLSEDLRVRAEPALVRAVDGEEDALGRSGRELALQLVERHKRVLGG
jgi:hypothetical protein